MKKEERRKILSLLSEGKISSEEAEKKLEDLEKKDFSGNFSIEKKGTKKKPNFLVVRIASEGKSGDKVNIKVPLVLIKTGAKLAALMPQDVQKKVNHAMKEKGLGFDLETLSKKDFDEVLLTLSDFHINIESGKDKIELFCE